MATKAELGIEVWPVLVEAARARRAVTYEEVASALDRPFGQWVRHALDPVQDYCMRHKLPPLTILVVNKATRKPGEGFIAWTGALSEGQEAVWRHDWLSIATPTAQEFEEAALVMARVPRPEGEELQHLEPLPAVEVVDVHDRIEELLRRRTEFQTMTLRRPFRARMRELDVELILDSGETRRAPYRDLVAVLRRWKTLEEPRIGSFQSDTRHASYLCVLIQEALGLSR